MSSDLSCPLGDKAGNKTKERWGDLARAAYPGYNGTRPKAMIVHGMADTALSSHCSKPSLASRAMFSASLSRRKPRMTP